MHTFETERLIIRPLTQDDKTMFCALNSDDKIMRYVGKTLTPEKAESAFNNAMKKIN